MAQKRARTLFTVSICQLLEHMLVHVIILSPRPLLQIRQITSRQVWLVRSDGSSRTLLRLCHCHCQAQLSKTFSATFRRCHAFACLLARVAASKGTVLGLCLSNPACLVVTAKMGASFTLKWEEQLVQVYVVICKLYM